MQDRELYQQILGLHSPWSVGAIQLDVQRRRVGGRRRASRGDPLRVPGVRMLPGLLRPRPGAGVAASGHDAVSDHPQGSRAAGELSRARRQTGARAMGREGEPLDLAL